MNKKIREATKEEIKVACNDIKQVKKINRELAKIVDIPTEDKGIFDICYIPGLSIVSAEKLGFGLTYRLIDASRQRNKRLYVRVKRMLESGKALFITLTFNDLTLESTNQDTRKQYVRKYLKEYCTEYVANIDFGAKKQREHYHAVVVPKLDKLDPTPWHNYGANNIKRVYRVEDYQKVAKYVNKLTNHALKDNGFYKRLIFSRA